MVEEEEGSGMYSSKISKISILDCCFCCGLNPFINCCFPELVGGYGTVYRARSKNDRTRVAIKCK